jgi:exosortase/archaeosortase family protein
LAALGVIFLLLHAANLTEALSYLSRPLVVAAASALGIDAVNRGSELVLGGLVLPWTQDCSGINTLIILWGVTLWTNRHRPFDRNALLRLLLCVPAALLANALRILTLAGYRYLFYPSWESEELHYLIGFLWLLPFLFLFVEDLRRMQAARWIEVVYLTLVLALVAPAIFSPGGSLVALSALFFLAHSGLSSPAPRHLTAAYTLWVAAALLIAWSDMESLWLPWLLVNPRLVSVNLLSSLTGLVILSGSLSVLAMRPEWQFVVGIALAIGVYRMLRGETLSGSRGPMQAVAAPQAIAISLVGLAPFVLPGLVGTDHAVERPPTGVMARQLTFNSYQIGLTGQPADIRVYWYGAFGDGRHHSLPSCMRFRGLILEPVPEQPEVLTGGDRWMRDIFLHRGELKTSYRDYLLASFSPFAPPGVHVILDAPADAMSAAYFARATDRLAERLYRLYLLEQAGQAGGQAVAAVP